MADKNRFDWGVFHDGLITGLEVSGDALVLKVEIDYLAERMSPPTAYFKVSANKFKKIRFEVYGGGMESDPSRIKVLEPEILYFKMEGDIRILECSNGLLSMKYADEKIFDDNDRPVNVEAINQVAIQYWDDFGNRKTGEPGHH